MKMFAGLDVGFKRTAVCVLDEAGRIVWRGVVDTLMAHRVTSPLTWAGLPPAAAPACLAHSLDHL